MAGKFMAWSVNLCLKADLLALVRVAKAAGATFQELVALVEGAETGRHFS